MQKISNFPTLVMQFIHYSLLSTSILLLLQHTVAAVESTTSSSHPRNIQDFIKSSCQVTLYSNLCYSTLSSSYNGDPDLGRLTYVAIKVSLSETNRTADYVAAINNKIAAKDAAVRDCVELTKEAVGLVWRSMDEMKMVLKSGSGDRRKNRRGRKVRNSSMDEMKMVMKGRGRKRNESGKRKKRFELSNVQTWLSAAITNQDTCIEGFNDVQGGKKVDDEVSEKVGYVVKLISNALSLVNSFAANA